MTTVLTLQLHLVVDIRVRIVVYCLPSDHGRRNVASVDRRAGSAAASDVAALDQGAHAASAATLAARRAGARDCRRTRPRLHQERRHRENSSPRYCRTVALRRRARTTVRSEDNSQRPQTRIRTQRRVVVQARPAARLGGERAALCRGCARRRENSAPPAALVAPIERRELPMAGRRPELISLLLLRCAGGAEQAVLCRALCARRLASASAAPEGGQAASKWRETRRRHVHHC